MYILCVLAVGAFWQSVNISSLPVRKKDSIYECNLSFKIFLLLRHQIKISRHS